MSIKLTLPYPPSANVNWRSGNGKIYKSDASKHYRSELLVEAHKAGIHEPLTGDLVVSVDVYRPQKRGDLDNRLKVLLDCMNDVVFQDDEQIVEIHARRFEQPKLKRGEGKRKGYVIVEVKAA